MLGAKCGLKADWLAAEGSGTVEHGLTMRTLRRHAVEVNLNRDTDLVAMIDRLLSAMTEGDAARVHAIPEGSGCPAPG